MRREGDIFLRLSRPTYPIRSFHRSFPAEIYQYPPTRRTLSLCSSLLLRLLSILFLRNYFGIRLDSISVALEPRPHTKRLSPPTHPPLPVSFETVIMTWANVLYLSDVYIRVCTNVR